MKKMVPQEQQDQIIDLYTNKQYGLGKIIKELNLDYGQAVVKRILMEHNIHIRTFKEAKVGRYKQYYDESLAQSIIDLYSKGYGLDKIVAELKLPFSFDKVRSILKDYNIPIRNVKEAHAVTDFGELRKYSINDNYNFESHNGAWILGLIASDGYLPKGSSHNRIVISLQRKDEDALQLIKEELQYTGPIYQYIAGGCHEESSLAFTSKQLRKKIESYGITNNKTFTLKKIPNLKEEFKIDFIRGFWDGDGSFYIENNSHRLASSLICASKDFLQDVADFLEKRYNFPKRNIYVTHRQHDIYYFRFGKYDSLRLGSLFYDNDYLALPRKKNKYLNYTE